MGEHDQAPGTSPLPPPTVVWSPPAMPSAPAGYLQFGGTPAKVEPTATLRTASIIARFVGVAGSAIAGALFLYRARVVERVASGQASRGDLDLPKTLATVAYQFGTFAGLAGTVLLCLWSSRTATNGTLVHANTRASPGLAGGGWFIPVGNFWVPWRHLRRAMGPAPRSAALAWWQGLTIASSVAFIPIGVAAAIGAYREAVDREVSASIYRMQGFGLLAAAVTSVVTIIVSMRAMRDVDDATSGRPLWPGA